MVAHIARLHVLKRDNAVTVLPSGAGISGGITVNPGTAGGNTALAFDTNAPDSGSQTAIPLANSIIPTITVDSSTPTPATPTVTPSITPTDSSDASSTGTSSSNVIPIGTVVGACIGALAGAIIIVLLGLYCYKRSAPKRAARHPRSPMSAGNNARGEMARRRSRAEGWDKLGDDEDKWEKNYQTKELSPSPATEPMEKLDMFKKSTPSIRTAYTHQSEEPPMFQLGPHPFAKAQPPVQEKEPQTVVRQFLGRVDTGPAISWDGETVGNGSFLSLKSHLSGTISPTHDKAIPVPSVTSSQPHRWESAEVVDFDDPTAEEDKNPFAPKERGLERGRSAHNPFFGSSKDRDFSHSRSLSRSSKTDKGKGRERYTNNPFDDSYVSVALPEPAHTHPDSGVLPSNDQAMQSLIAALDLTPEEHQERLRITSMQASVISGASMYTEEEDMTQSFPLPPSQQ